jgi:hypothetical protein
MTISFLFFHFFLSLLYPPVLPLRPCPSCSAIPPASQPYAPSQPSAASISQSSSSSSPLPSGSSGAVDSSPPRPRAAALRGEVAERRRPARLDVRRRRPASWIELRGRRIGFPSSESSSGGGESGSGRQWRHGRGGDGERVLRSATSRRAGARPQAAAEAIPQAVAVLDCRAVSKGSLGPRPCAA